MERLFLECTLRAALLVGGTAIVLYVMRVKQAALRHRVWTGVMALMLMLPVWTAWGPRVPLRVLPALPQITTDNTMVPAGNVPTAVLPSPLVSPRQAVLLGIYFLGLCFLLIRLATGTARARRLAREAVVEGSMRINSLCAAPVTVGLFHPVVILPKHWRQWSKAQLGAILTHEGEHVRRRDSLVQWLALLNRALFWFHPAAWWLECTLSALAEEACDDAVLAHGHNPHEYSECLIEMARSVMQSGARVNVAGMAMPGSLLPKRIRKIIEDVPIPRISRARLTCVAVICTIMCSLTVAATLARVPQAATDQPTKPERHFDALQILTPHEGVDFTAFSHELVRTVRRNWMPKIPVEAKQKTGTGGGPAKGKVVVRFRIQKDGRLGSLPIVEVSSGNKPLDDAAVSAIHNSAPFEPLPDSFKGPDIELRLGFFYNVPMSALNP